MTQRKGYSCLWQVFSIHHYRPYTLWAIMLPVSDCRPNVGSFVVQISFTLFVSLPYPNLYPSHDCKCKFEYGLLYIIEWCRCNPVENQKLTKIATENDMRIHIACMVNISATTFVLLSKLTVLSRDKSFRTRQQKSIKRISMWSIQFSYDPSTNLMVNS